MEDLYDDLSNYDDVNVVQELRNENMELKVKLEEHAAAMEKLQKDYDTLEMEFKKLENNYSSLLKTARSEIERKSQRISQLNLEKDMMVLSALKNGKRIKRHFNNVPNANKISNEKPNKWTQNKKVQDDDAKLKAVDPQKGRSETNAVQTKNNTPGSGIDNMSDSINKFENSGDNKMKSNVKENMPHRKTEHNYTPKTLASSIRDRRKSASAVSMNTEKFYSNEKHEQKYITKSTRTDHAPIDKFERKHENKITIDRHSNEPSESSSVDDRNSNYYELRDNYRGRLSRQHDNSTYRGRDKYEISLKNRKHYSPDRAQKRQYRDYKDDYYRQEQGRYRVLESPPRDSSDRYHRRNLDCRTNYDRHSYENEKPRHRYEEKYPTKYKVSYDHDEKYKASYDHDEPHTKRQKIESYRNPEEYYMEDKRYYSDKESAGKQSIPEYSPHEYNVLRLSCQSPDYVHTDATFTDPVKEIMATAATPLEDPRVTSKRYVFKKENGKEILSTAMGRNVDIEFFDRSKWNLESINIPVALVRRPSQCSEDLVKDIYMGIDNSEQNLSIESSDVHFESEDEVLTMCNKTNEDFNMNKQAIENCSVQATDSENITSITKYRIPKIGQNNTQSQIHIPTIDPITVGVSKRDQSRIDVPLIDQRQKIVATLDHSPINVPMLNESKINISGTSPSMTADTSTEMNKNILDNNDVTVTLPVKDIFTKKLLARQRQNDDYDNILSNTSKNKYECIKESQNQIKLSKMAIVADDLELSDENSDNVDAHKQVTQKEAKNCKVITKSDNKCKLDTRSHNKADDNVNEKTVDAVEIKVVQEEEKTKESDSAKKQKSKKKRSKSKEVTKVFIENKDSAQVTEKKTKTKKDKEAKPKETKQKFSDLFGDSSSLMTPEDLGIPTYLPISEDAQDAVDMKINEIIDSPPLMDKPVTADRAKVQSSLDEKQKVTTHNNFLETVPQKSNIEDKEAAPKDFNKKTCPKKTEEVLNNNEISSKDIYENVNPGTDSNEPDVVKTVIISRGVQPEISFKSNLEVTENYSAGLENRNQNKDHILMPPVKRHDLLKALATSTPQKEFTDFSSSQPDFAGHSNGRNIIEVRDNLPQADDKNYRNTLDTNDAPDVRIFVKRRRKLVKRPPMT